MPIKGLTDQHAKHETDTRGRPVRLGYIQKGSREGFSGKIKLHDHNWLVFKPATQDKAEGAKLTAVFDAVYGPQPRAINDVRIPVSLAGNFDIEKCAWLTSSKHTEKGSIFLAQSDGETITMARNENGRVVRGLELSHANYSQKDSKGNDCFVYRGKLYPWQKSMAIDLILPEFNEALFKERIAGLGVVTLLTHSTNDIATLIGEYHQVLDEIAGLFSDPRDPDGVERVKRYTPLRDIPLRLQRSEDKITSPAYGKEADPADKIKSTRWLLHWQLNPDFALAASNARAQRTALLLQAVGNAVPLLSAPSYTADQANEELLGLPAPAPKTAVPANGTNGHANSNANGNGHKEPETIAEGVYSDFSELSETDDIDAPEVELIEDDPAPWEEAPKGQAEPVTSDYDWETQAKTAKTLDVFASAVYQICKAVFENANIVRIAYGHMFGEFDQTHNEAALQGFKTYTQQLGDGVKKADAIKAAQKGFKANTAVKQGGLPLAAANTTCQE